MQGLSKSIRAQRKSLWFPGLIFVMLVSGAVMQPFSCWAEEEGAKPPSAVVTPEQLVDMAERAKKHKEYEKAAIIFLKLHRTHPDAPMAGESLWYAAQYRKRMANLGKLDWSEARDLFREYTSFYTDGPYLAEAYFEVAHAYYRMRFLREALTYFKLFARRFQDHELLTEAKVWQGKILVEVGRLGEAEDVFRDLASSRHEPARIKGLVGLARLTNARQDYAATLDYFHEINAKNPFFFRHEPEGLLVFGQAYIHSGRIDKGQQQLVHYLNLVGEEADRTEILFELGESYHRVKKYTAARKMYERAADEGRPGQKSMVFSQMRMAQYLDDPDLPRSKWARPHDLTDSRGDAPYMAVLEYYYKDPMAQDARLGLFKRYLAREDFDNLLDTGRNYLRNARIDPASVSDPGEIGSILLALAKGLVAKEKYQELYDLYFTEHEHVSNFKDGRFLYYVGRAMEALSLYDQAAVIYYRALKWPLPDEEKIDLYYRRARVYLLMEDLEAGERLLKYLRKTYRGTGHSGEIYWYSGRLREAQERPEQALEFYMQAADKPTFGKKKGVYAAAVIRLCLQLGKHREALFKIDEFRSRGLLGADSSLQEWYVKTGDAMRLAGACDQALEAYGLALGQELPKEGEPVQSAHLFQGDCLMATDDTEAGIASYRLAETGKDERLKKIARERLNQHEIDTELSNLKVEQ